MEIKHIAATSTKEFQLKRVAAYVRVSSDKDAAEHSLAAQISHYNEYISSYPGWIFAGIYADDGFSGTKDDRPEFQRLIADCRAGKIDMIITKSVARFARNTVTFLNTIRELKAFGIKVLFETEHIESDSPMGELMISVIAMMAEQESLTASKNKRWQIQKYFEEGRPTYFRLYGYKWVNEQLEIIPEEAEIVKRIYSEYLAGSGPTVIAKRLNRDNIPSLKSRWTRNSVHGILCNEKYTGNMILQKTHTPDFRTKKRVTNNGQWAKYHVEGSHEAIIDIATFEAAHREILNRQTKFSIQLAPAVSLFSGLIICHKCGTKFLRKMAPTSTGKYPIWKCITSVQMGKDYCSAKQIRESILIEKTKEALGLPANTELTREIILVHIDHIESAADNKLRFFLKSGKVEVVSWENPSRSKSWTPEMKEKARQKSLAINKARKEATHA